MLTLNGKKMSKSSENFILPENLFNGNSELIEKGFEPMVVKFFDVPSTLQKYLRPI